MEINGVDIDLISEQELLRMYEEVLEDGSLPFFAADCVCGPKTGSGHGSSFCHTYGWCNYTK